MKTSAARILLAAWLALPGCAPSASSRPTSPTAATAEAPHGAPDGFPWTAPLDRDHPLVGKVWSPARGFVAARALPGLVATVRFVLLGEKHDAADHHRLQAWLARAVASDGRAPALVFEQLDREAQPAIDAARASSPHDVEAIAKAAGWEKSGWPPFAEYAPIVAVGVERGLPILAGNLSRTDARRVVHEGAAAFPEAERHALALDVPLPPPLETSLEGEFARSHCGMPMPEAFTRGMVAAERARDALLARALLAGDEASHGQGAVLVAGTGHTRRDRGVPWALGQLRAPREEGAPRDLVSVAFVEVEPGRTDPAAYGDLWDPSDRAPPPPFDYLVFTPRANDDDPCAAFRGKTAP